MISQLFKYTLILIVSIGLNAQTTKIIDGVSGTDTLSIAYAGITGVSDFAVSVDGDYKVLTDANNNVIKFKNIENIQIAGISYVDIYDGRSSSSQWTINVGAGYDDPSTDYNKTYAFAPNFDWHNNIISSAFYSSTEDLVALYSFDEGKGSNFTIPSFPYLFRDENGRTDDSYLTRDYTILGTVYNDGVSDRNGESCVSGDFNISTYAGDDVISMTGYCLSAQTLDAGSGDDKVFINPNFLTKNNVSAEGGTDEDWIIVNSYSDPVTYILNTSNTSGFENIKTGNGTDTITGDTNNNIIYAYGGADTVYGLAGDDVLYGSSPIRQDLGQDSDDILYGGAGNDTLIGGPGDNTLDGGIGQDTLTGKGGLDDGTGSIDFTNYYGEYGINTFIIRAGDGGPSIDSADVITDFEDNNDLIGMANGLEFNQLTIEQGTGDYANHVVVKKKDTGEFLVVIQSITIENITDADFTAI
jgi:Ca2+-binding RTX toxin-like protein